MTDDKLGGEGGSADELGNDYDANRDAITGEPGSHPIGTGMGAAAAGTAGMLAGAVLGGPVGAVIMGAVGAALGGFVGHDSAEHVDPTNEDAYWRDTYAARPYTNSGHPYETYQPAYKYGWESRIRNSGREYHEVESELERDWHRVKGESPLAWEDAKHAVHDAWHRT